MLSFLSLGNYLPTHCCPAVLLWHRLIRGVGWGVTGTLVFAWNVHMCDSSRERVCDVFRVAETIPYAEHVSIYIIYIYIYSICVLYGFFLSAVCSVPRQPCQLFSRCVTHCGTNNLLTVKREKVKSQMTARNEYNTTQCCEHWGEGGVFLKPPLGHWTERNNAGGSMSQNQWSIPHFY